MGGRRILKSARVLPFVVHSETFIVLLLGALLGLGFQYLRENQDLAMGKGIISVRGLEERVADEF